MKTLNLYTIEEIKESHPDSYDTAIEAVRGRLLSESPIWAHETCESVRGFFEAAGVTLKDWRLGAYSPSYIRIETIDGGELTGARAMAWAENNLLSGLRIPWVGKYRDETRKYGKGYRPGRIKPCPFTGYCADDDILDGFTKAIADGDTIKEALEGVGSVTQKLLEDEYDHEQSEEYLHDHAAANEYDFDENGCIH